jgi:hypothetical protein
MPIPDAEEGIVVVDMPKHVDCTDLWVTAFNDGLTIRVVDKLPVRYVRNLAMVPAFEAGYDIPRLLTSIQAGTGTRIAEGETLVILDEVQECPKALASLKYFCEDAPGLHVSAAGSLLGLAARQGTGFPAGKVNALDLHPLTFREFMDATGNGMLRELVDEGTPSASIRSRHVWPLCFGSIASLAECRGRSPRSSDPGCFPTRAGSSGRCSATIAWMSQGTSLRSKPGALLPCLAPFLRTFRARARSSSSGGFEKGPARATTGPRPRGSRGRGWRPGLDGSRSLVLPCPHMLAALRSGCSCSTWGCSARWRARARGM